MMSCLNVTKAFAASGGARIFWLPVHSQGTRI